MDLFKLTPEQWKLYAGAVSNIAQAVILFSLAAMFVPESVNLARGYSFWLGLVYFAIGLYFLYFSGILVKKGKES